MKNTLIKSLIVASMTMASMGAQAAVDFHSITCADEAKWVEKLGITSLNGLTLVPVGSEQTKFKTVDFSPYHNNSIETAGRIFQMIETKEDLDGNVSFYTSPFNKNKYHRGGFVFKFTKVEDNVYDMSLWTEAGKPVNGYYEFVRQKPISRASKNGSLRMKVTKESIEARDNASCVN